MTTTEKNKLLANFITEPKKVLLENYYHLPQYGEYQCKYGNIDFKETFRAEELKFYEDWRWLMPVVEKIETMSNDKQFYITVEYDNREEFKGWSYHIDQWLKTIISNDDRVTTKIEATYNACVEFVCL